MKNLTICLESPRPNEGAHNGIANCLIDWVFSKLNGSVLDY